MASELMKTRRLAPAEKVDCLVPVKIKPADFKRFTKARVEHGIPYATTFARKIVLDYINDWESKKQANSNKTREKKSNPLTLKKKVKKKR